MHFNNVQDLSGTKKTIQNSYSDMSRNAPQKRRIASGQGRSFPNWFLGHTDNTLKGNIGLNTTTSEISRNYE